MATGWPGTDTFTIDSPNWPEATKARPVAGSMVTSLAAPTAGTNPTRSGFTETDGVYVTVRVLVPALLAASLAVTVMTLVPACSGTDETDQAVVPEAGPLHPRSEERRVGIVTPS